MLYVATWSTCCALNNFCLGTATTTTASVPSAATCQRSSTSWRRGSGNTMGCPRHCPEQHCQGHSNTGGVVYVAQHYNRTNSWPRRDKCFYLSFLFLSLDLVIPSLLKSPFSPILPPLNLWQELKMWTARLLGFPNPCTGPVWIQLSQILCSKNKKDSAQLSDDSSAVNLALISLL